MVAFSALESNPALSPQGYSEVPEKKLELQDSRNELMVKHDHFG